MHKFTENDVDLALVEMAHSDPDGQQHWSNKIIEDFDSLLVYWHRPQLAFEAGSGIALWELDEPDEGDEAMVSAGMALISVVLHRYPDLLEVFPEDIVSWENGVLLDLHSISTDAGTADPEIFEKIPMVIKQPDLFGFALGILHETDEFLERKPQDKMADVRRLIKLNTTIAVLDCCVEIAAEMDKEKEGGPSQPQ